MSNTADSVSRPHLTTSIAGQHQHLPLPNSTVPGPVPLTAPGPPLVVPSRPTHGPVPPPPVPVRPAIGPRPHPRPSRPVRRSAEACEPSLGCGSLADVRRSRRNPDVGAARDRPDSSPTAAGRRPGRADRGWRARLRAEASGGAPGKAPGGALGGDLGGAVAVRKRGAKPSATAHFIYGTRPNRNAVILGEGGAVRKPAI